MLNMKATMSRGIPWTAAFRVWAVIARSAEPVYPVKVSENGRYFIDQWVMMYLGSKASFSINMDKLAAARQVKAFWIDPKTELPVEISWSGAKADIALGKRPSFLFILAQRDSSAELFNILQKNAEGGCFRFRDFLVNQRKVNLKSRAHADLRVDPDVAARLFDYSVDGGEAQARPFALRLRREERLEDMFLRLRV